MLVAVGVPLFFSARLGIPYFVYQDFFQERLIETSVGRGVNGCFPDSSGKKLYLAYLYFHAYFSFLIFGITTSLIQAIVSSGVCTCFTLPVGSSSLYRA